jgi:hypothetical protein
MNNDCLFYDDASAVQVSNILQYRLMSFFDGCMKKIGDVQVTELDFGQSGGISSWPTIHSSGSMS